MLEDLKDFLRIYTWKEFWILIGCASLTVGVWVFISIALKIPNDALRTVVLWGFIFLLFILGGVTEKSRKKSQSP